MIVDASGLRHCQPKRGLSLANIAYSAAMPNSKVPKLALVLPEATPDMYFVRRYPIQKQKHDRELQQVLREVENTANDALQFKAWKLSVESQFSLGIKGQPLAARPKSGQN